MAPEARRELAEDDARRHANRHVELRRQARGEAVEESVTLSANYAESLDHEGDEGAARGHNRRAVLVVLLRLDSARRTTRLHRACIDNGLLQARCDRDVDTAVAE